MPPNRDLPVVVVLRAFGGEATLGDLLAVTAMARVEVERQLDVLLAGGLAHVRVSSSGDVVYHLASRRPVARTVEPWTDAGAVPGRAPGSPSSDPDRAPVLPARAFDRKTLQLIRARAGVLSIAELVEHTGLRVAAAEREMARLAECFGGVPYVSLDDHVVHAFPELMTSAHGRFPDREPRPAWVRARPPLGPGRWRDRIFGRSGRERLRRYALGLVVQTALAGKGIVSRDRTVAYLRERTGQHVGRHAVGAALRDLADDFDAPCTELGGDTFFAFRSLKRQFLASEMVRRQVALARTASAESVFDTADSPARAADRDLRRFDEELKKTMTLPR